MWSTLLVLAVPIALDPVRLGFNLLLISRPRPAQNLLVYWVGCMLVSLLLVLVPIVAVHSTPMFSSFVHDLASPGTPASTTVRYLEIFAGVLVLAVAAAMAVRFFARQRGQVPTRSAGTSTVVADADTSHPISRLLGRRWLTRATNAWESGSLWVALAIGFWAGPNPSMVVFALATIVPSGAAIGTQIGAAILFVIETLVVVEVVLLSHLIAPTKTEALLRLLHDWTRAYRWQIVVAMLTFVGLALVAQGMGII